MTRVEYVREIVGPMPYQAEPPAVRYDIQKLTFPRGLLTMQDTPRTSFAVQAATLEFSPTGHLLLRGSTSALGIRGGERDGLPRIKDEADARTFPGTFLNLGVGDFEGSASGDVWFYWLNQTAQLWANSSWYALESEVWDEGVAGLIHRHVVWYEVSGKTPGITLRVAAAGAANILYAAHAEIPAASTIALASGSGDLAGMTVPEDASVWLDGNLAIVATPAIQGEARAFRLDVTGQLRQFSFAGSPDVVRIDPTIALSTGAILLALVIAAIVGRQALSPLAIVLYTKLRKDKLLNIGARDTIYRVIQQAPGINFVELQKQVGSINDGRNTIGFGALAYHLGQMERFELIVSKREGRFRRYFDVGAKMGADAARVALLQTFPVNLVARAVLDSPGANQGDIHARTNPNYTMTRQALSYHLRRLAEKELIAIEIRGRFCHYSPTEKLERLSAFVTTAPATTMPSIPELPGAPDAKLVPPALLGA